jgi:hypothetical protein
VVKPPQTSSSEAGETRVRNMAAEFCLRASFHARRVLLYAVNLRHGTDGFASSPDEGVATDFITLKIHRPLPGLNPRTLGPVASTLTTRLPRATCTYLLFNKICERNVSHHLSTFRPYSSTICCF